MLVLRTARRVARRFVFGEYRGLKHLGATSTFPIPSAHLSPHRMPTYEFRCPDGHEFERFYRKISDAVAELPCPECGKLATRQLSAGAGLLFKGSGFYLTDYGKNAHRKAAPSGDGAKSADKPAESGASESTSKPEKPAESTASAPAKPEASTGETKKPKKDS